jgi:hypothetical protein
MSINDKSLHDGGIDNNADWNCEADTIDRCHSHTELWEHGKEDKFVTAARKACAVSRRQTKRYQEASTAQKQTFRSWQSSQVRKFHLSHSSMPCHLMKRKVFCASEIDKTDASYLNLHSHTHFRLLLLDEREKNWSIHSRRKKV